MVRAIRAGVPHRASGELALHVLEMMTAIESLGRERRASSSAVETRSRGAGTRLTHNGIHYVTATDPQPRQSGTAANRREHPSASA